MQLKFFTIPIICKAEDEETLNKFLRSVRVLELKKELVRIENSVFWAVSVLYLPGSSGEVGQITVKGKVDYKNILSESEFAKFCQFRKIRKHLADLDAVPAYAVFTDSELSAISRLDDVSVSSLKGINGIGVKKLDKYGVKFCELFAQMIQNEEGREFA